jgi:hypothetical protein
MAPYRIRPTSSHLCDRLGHTDRGDAPQLGLPALAGNQGGAKVSSASSRTFEDVKVGVRCKIAALWIAADRLVRLDVAQAGGNI